MRTCPFCGRIIDDDVIYCSGCGKELDTSEEVVQNLITDAMLHYDEMPDGMTSRYGKIKCPRCGEHNLHPINETSSSIHTSGGGYSSSKGLLGWLLLGPLGLLCGGMGQNQRTSINTVNKLFWVCNECGYKFRNLDDWNSEIEMRIKQQKLNKYSAITFIILAVLPLSIGGGMVLLTILFFMIAISNAITALTLGQIIRSAKADYEQLKEVSLD